MFAQPNRILVLTPVFPKLNKGAAEQDQIYGALHLQQLGHTVRMAAFLPGYQTADEVHAYSQQIGLDVTSTAYPVPGATFRTAGQRLIATIRQPLLLDGAAYQHAHPLIFNFVADQIRSFRPDLIWLDNNFLWPIARLAKAHGVPVVIRSQNFEPEHVLAESGRSLLNYIRYAAKFMGEAAALYYSRLLIAITPVERAKYARLAQANKIELLPLRSLPIHLRPPRPANHHLPLHVFYWGSTYNVSHNHAALEFVTQHIWPRVRAQSPGDFCLHVYGGKVPPHIQSLAANDLVIHGFVSDLEIELDKMDIALVPSLYGCGMQQKVFEPLCRGFPTVTTKRGLAGYPFTFGLDVLTAQTPDEFTAHLLLLRDPQLRANLSENASRRAAELFSTERQMEALNRIIQRALRSIAD